MDIKGIIGILVVLGSFALMAINPLRGQQLDVAAVAVGTGALMAVVGFYFGHQNGKIDGLVSNMSDLVTTAQGSQSKFLDSMDRIASKAIVGEAVPAPSPPPAAP